MYPYYHILPELSTIATESSQAGLFFMPFSWREEWF